MIKFRWIPTFPKSKFKGFRVVWRLFYLNSTYKTLIRSVLNEKRKLISETLCWPCPPSWTIWKNPSMSTYPLFLKMWYKWWIHGKFYRIVEEAKIHIQNAQIQKKIFPQYQMCNAKIIGCSIWIACDNNPLSSCESEK